MSDESFTLEGDNPKLPIIIASTLIVVLTIVAICVGVDQYYKFTIRDEINSKVLAPPNSALRELRAMEKHNLHSWQWVDKKAPVPLLRIPIDHAADLTLNDWAKRPEGVTPIEGAAPTPAPAVPGTVVPAVPGAVAPGAVAPAAPADGVKVIQGSGTPAPAPTAPAAPK